MLYWHLGLKRTGTTSLQSALIAHRDRLSAAGVAYPQEWLPPGRPTHHKLLGVIVAPSDDPRVSRFRRYLEAHREDSVVFSSEVVSDVLSGGLTEKFLETLAIAESVTPVKCALTLRRIDDLIVSQRLLALRNRGKLLVPGPEDAAGIAKLFSTMLDGMRRVADVLDQRMTYLKYDPDSAHSMSIVRSFVPAGDLRRSIEGAISAGPRLNAQLTQKATVALCHLDELSARAGQPIERGELNAALFRGQIGFDDDHPCELLGPELRKTLHRRGLAAAREHGVTAYLDFFEDAVIEERSAAELDASIVSDADLARLVSRLDELRRSRRGSPVR